MPQVESKGASMNPSVTTQWPPRQEFSPPRNGPSAPTSQLFIPAPTTTVVPRLPSARVYGQSRSDRRRQRKRRTAWMLGSATLAVIVVILGALALTHTGLVASADADADQDYGSTSTDLHPGVPVSTTGLAPELSRRLGRAQAAAEKQGITITVTSGWRSLEQQRQLYEQEIATYGSQEEASRWVLPPRESEHPKGRAIDIGPAQAGVWLNQHGDKYGLCRTYANEWWHFEPRVAPGKKCPAIVKNASDHRPATAKEILKPGPR